MVDKRILSIWLSGVAFAVLLLLLLTGRLSNRALSNAGAIEGGTTSKLIPHPLPESSASRALDESRAVTVQRVIDGDTLVLANGDKVRLVGIDTAEVRRTARAKGQAKKHGLELEAVIALGKEAAKAVVKLVEGKEVRLVEAYSPPKKDRYGRRLCYVEVNGKDVGESLLRAGLAWKYEDFEHPRLKRYRKVKSLHHR